MISRDRDIGRDVARMTGYFLAALVIAILVTAVLMGGCVTAAKNTVNGFTATPEPTATATPEPTPEPERIPDYMEDPGYTPPYDLWKYEKNQHNLSEFYTIRRENVQGLKDMTLRSTVYSVRQYMNFWTWEILHGGPTDGSADWPNVPDRGMKFVFVWVCTYLDGTGPGDDPSVWVLDYDHFYLEADGKIYENRMGNMDLTATIREFENIYDHGDTVRTGPYAIDIVQDLRNGRIKAEAKTYMRMGYSNRVDGWIVFQIPREIPLESVRVRGRFEHLGRSAYWSVKPGDVYPFDKQ